MTTRFVLRAAPVLVLVCAFGGPLPAQSAAGPKRLKVAIVQKAFAGTLEENRDAIIAGIVEAAARGARVAVAPEGALRGDGAGERDQVEKAVAAIAGEAAARGIYVVYGGSSHSVALKKPVNWMRVVGPDGRERFYYEKIYNNRRGPMPGVFKIDGVPCGAMICADRWLRGVEEIPIQLGARISFELSNNFACEWVEPYGWYWYVPRARRNSVWVVLANTGNTVAGQPDAGAEATRLRHGHSAVIAPDGRVVAGASDVATLVLAEIEVDLATGAEAQARANHPALRAFWEAGLKVQRGESIRVPPIRPLESAATDITIAVAQVTGDAAAMAARIREARQKGADLVAFPARAVSADALEAMAGAARENRITVVFGAEFRDGAGAAPRNSAFVIGPDGALLTRYDQLSAPHPYQAGLDPATMWFWVKGVPAVVTIERDGLWNELAEVTAVAGAQVHVHLDRDPDNAPEARLRRIQVWSNLASFRTFTATANVVGSAIWDDVEGKAQTEAFLKHTTPPDRGPVEVNSVFSANLVVAAGPDAPLIVATRRVSRTNGYIDGRPRVNPQMEPWLRYGGALLGPKERKAP